MRKSRLTIFILLFLNSLTFVVSGQDTLLVKSVLQEKRQADSVISAGYLRKASLFKEEGQADSAIRYIDKALSIADDGSFLSLSAYCYELRASIYDPMISWEATLTSYLKAAETYRKAGEKANEARILSSIAGYYFTQGIFKKAALYYEQEYFLIESHESGKRAFCSEKIAEAYHSLNLDSVASKWYEASAADHGKADDFSGLLRCREKLALLYSDMADHQRSLAEYADLLSTYTSDNNTVKIAFCHNQTGVIKFRMNDLPGALESFDNAVEVSQKGSRDDFFLTEVWSNKAICYQNLENEKEMLDCFTRALEYARNSGRADEAARINRIMAMISFKNGDNYHAEVYCLNCIASAIKSGNYEILQLCYRDYSDVLENGNDFIKALEYYEKYLNLRDSLNYEKRLAEKEAGDKIAAYESIEQNIKDAIASGEIRGLEMKNLRAESLRRENEISLLIKKQELDRSEKERLADSLALEKERYELNKKEQDIISLRNRQEIDSLTLVQKNTEADALETRNQLLETEKQQQEESAKKARQIRNMAIGIGILMGLVAIMVLFGLLSTRKQNQKLAESKRQIEKINLDLEQTNTEVLKQKDIIEQKNQSITDSIQYARRIQSAVLPPFDFLNEYGLPNFILFKPKDIVSGDFYWGSRKNDSIIIAAADCTGHGVPGAFMSMLGNAFLDEIINTRKIINAADILNLLREEIIKSLKQKGTEGETRDGMDISLVILNRKTGMLDFAGANNPLYLVRDGKLIKYEADRMPIGIHFISFTPFTNQKIEIKKGDLLYLSSDGFADQFGGPRGKKLMYKPYQDLLLRVSSMPVYEQKEHLNNYFESWKGEREQVDDVMVIGIKI